MPREFSRHQRVADFLKREIAQIIQLEMRDPRVGMVNVTAVEVTRDLALAKIYVTFFQDSLEERQQSEIDEMLAVLNKAAGFLRSRVAQEHKMRSTPSLRFYYDASVERGQHLSSLIDKAVAADKHLHEAAQSGQSELSSEASLPDSESAPQSPDSQD